MGVDYLVLVERLLEAIREHEHSIDNGMHYTSADDDLYDLADEIEAELEADG